MTNRAKLICCLREVDDPRKRSYGALHDFMEILLIARLAVLSDCETVEDIALRRRNKQSSLRQCLVPQNGAPSEQSFLRVFLVLNPKQFEVTFRRWVAEVVGVLKSRVAVDGKTVRGLGSGGETSIHILSALATELGLVVGREKVAAESYAITAIRQRLQALYIERLLISINAKACQGNIGRQIGDQGGDYLMAANGNQRPLRQAIETDCFIGHYQSGGDGAVARGDRGRSTGCLAQFPPMLALAPDHFRQPAGASRGVSEQRSRPGTRRHRLPLLSPQGGGEMFRHLDERPQPGRGIGRQCGVHRESGPPGHCQRPLSRPAGAPPNGSSARNRGRESIAQAGPVPDFRERRDRSPRMDGPRVFRDPSKADRQVLRCLRALFSRTGITGALRGPGEAVVGGIPMKQPDTVALRANSWE
jgi:hypothetical protein